MLPVRRGGISASLRLVIGSSGSSPVCQPVFCSSNCLKWFQGFSSKLWSWKQTWATAAFSAVLLKTGQLQVLICPRINVQPVIAKICRIKQREKRNGYIFIPRLQACSEMGLFFILEINGSKCTEMFQSQRLGVAWELCCEFIKPKFGLISDQCTFWCSGSSHLYIWAVRCSTLAGLLPGMWSCCLPQVGSHGNKRRPVSHRLGIWIRSFCWTPVRRDPRTAPSRILLRDRSVKEVRRSSKEWRWATQQRWRSYPHHTIQLETISLCPYLRKWC